MLTKIRTKLLLPFWLSLVFFQGCGMSSPNMQSAEDIMLCENGSGISSRCSF